MKRILGLLLASMTVFLITGMVYGWSDSLTLTCTPTGNRGVIMDSTTISFGTLDVNVTTMSISGVTVTSTGTLGNMEYTIAGTNAGTWQLETDGTVTPSGQNKVVLQALFQTTNAQPADATFGTDDTIDTNAQQVGDGASINFEGTGDMDTMALLTTRYLFFRFQTPPTTSVDTLQTFTVTVAAEVAN